MLRPRYPVYVPSKGRYENCLTARCLVADDVDFRLVVEPQEQDFYAAKFGSERVLVLPFANLGMGSIPCRNWIMEHSIQAGAARHWQLDDNMRCFRRWIDGRRVPVNGNIALRIAEDFTERYTNIAISGLSYTMFNVSQRKQGPFVFNAHVYSCTLVLNSVPYRWRLRYNEDTDICLQALAGGWCTVLINAFMVDKVRTMVLKGGNTDELYAGDGRLRMARMLERAWPGVVRVDRRYDRPQHVVNWKKFRNIPQIRTDLDLSKLPTIDEYGMELVEQRHVKTSSLRKWARDQ